MEPKYSCDYCRSETLSLYCYFKQNVSYFFERKELTISGWFCPNCMSKNFTRVTVKTILGTWWGLIGFFIGPFYIYNNIKEYFKFKIRFYRLSLH
jgi:hypothetical protein